MHPNTTRKTPAPQGLWLVILIAAILSLIALPAAAQQESGGTENAAAEEAEIDWSPGMYLPFDGSSVKAFDKSLEEIQAETTEAEFTTLQNALDYLLVYDLAARRDREVLYERLNGKTPVDVIHMVKWKVRGPSDGA